MSLFHWATAHMCSRTCFLSSSKSFHSCTQPHKFSIRLYVFVPTSANSGKHTWPTWRWDSIRVISFLHLQKNVTYSRCLLTLSTNLSVYQSLFPFRSPWMVTFSELPYGDREYRDQTRTISTTIDLFTQHFSKYKVTCNVHAFKVCCAEVAQEKNSCACS